SRGFVGGTADPVTGLTNLGAREYDPALDHFISPDPVLNPTDPRSLNPYGYADDNPATNADPTGEICVLYHNTPECYPPRPSGGGGGGGGGGRHGGGGAPSGGGGLHRDGIGGTVVPRHPATTRWCCALRTTTASSSRSPHRGRCPSRYSTRRRRAT